MRRFAYGLVSLAAIGAGAAWGCGSGGDDGSLFKGQTGGATSSGSIVTSSATTASGMGGSTTSGMGAGSAVTTTTSTTATTGAGGASNPGIISISPDTILESETHVAAAPNGFVGVTWIAEKQGGQSTNGYIFSKDGGKSWGPIQEVASPGGRVASDPVFAIDQQNNFYMTWIGFHFDNQGQPYDMHVYVAVAPAGTTDFGAPIEVSAAAGGESFDKPWIVVTNKNTAILTYAKTSSGGSYAARSTDGGKTWTRAVIVEDGNFRNLTYPCAPATGDRIWAVYSVNGGGGIGLRWSDDDGLTWPDANKTAVAAMGEPAAFDDPTCAAEGNDVFVSYSLSNDQINGGANAPKGYALRLAHSGDGGVTIDYRADEHDAASGKFFQHAQLTRESNGALDVTYYAGSADPDANGSFRRARSTDGGKTWGASVSILKPLDFLSSRTDPHWLGDYSGIWWLNGTLFTSYVDNSQQYAHVAFYSTPTP